MTERISHGEARRQEKHGHVAGGVRSAEYNLWQNMRQRCGNPKHSHYHRYGGRGIRVCDEWQNSFSSFISHIGPRPSAQHSIDRIDNDGNYEPGNVRWATRKAQTRNYSRNIMLTYNGETLCLEDWASRIGIDPMGLKWRVKNYPLEVALTKPVQARKRVRLG